MKRLRLLLMTALLTVLGGGSVLAATQQMSISVGKPFNYSSFVGISGVSITEGTPSTISWTTKLGNVGFLVNSDVSNYTTLVVDVSKNGEEEFPTDLQVSLQKQEGTYKSTWYTLKEGKNTIDISKELLNSSLSFDKLAALQSVALQSSSAGSVVVKSITFEYDDAIPAIVEAPAVAKDMIRYTVDLHKTGRTIAPDGSFNVINQCYKSSAGGNNLMLINEFNNSLKSDYNKMYISITKINKDGAARYNDGNTTYLADGVNEIDLTSVNLDNFQIGGHEGSEMVINYIYLEGLKQIVGTPVQYVFSDTLSVEMFKNYSSGTPTQAGCAYVLNESTGMPYGDGNVNWKCYADLSGYDKLAITVSAGQPRCCFNRQTENGNDNSDPAQAKMLDFNNNWTITKYQTKEDNTYYIDLTKIVKAQGYAYLHCIKGANWNDVTVTSMQLFKICRYNISGKGSLEDFQSVLNKPTLTSIDATGLTNEEAIAISTGNPNCLIIANEGKLSNKSNVLIKGADSYTCKSLALTDANDFAAPVDFTATDAAFKRTATGYDGWATVCLPFAAKVPKGVEAWEIESVKAGALNMKEITTIPANKAVLLQFDEATGLAVYASSATVAKTVAASGSGKTELVGVYAKQKAPVGSYVLQKKGGTLAFYKVAEGSQPNIPAFRAYLTVAPSAAKGNVMRINFEETTGISDMQNNETILTPAMKYNMAGQSVQHMKKGVQIQRMSDGSVRKVMVK